MTVAVTEPDGFRLVFAHAAQEPEFKAMAEQLRSNITEISLRQISDVVEDPQRARWAARLGTDRSGRGDPRLARRRAARSGPDRWPGPAGHRGRHHRRNGAAAPATVRSNNAAYLTTHHPEVIVGTTNQRTGRSQRYWDSAASRYDKQMAFI